MTDKFLSAPSARRATPMSRSICARRSKFLSTPSARRATLYNHRHAHCCQISIHALREEGDSGVLPASVVLRYFYPRPPRGGRLPSRCHSQKLFCISIHALREEGDLAKFDEQNGNFEISIHALCEEGDPVSDVELRRQNRFLSTPSARRATPPM